MKRMLLAAMAATLLSGVIGDRQAAAGEQARLRTSLAYPVMKSGDGERKTNHLHVAITGFEIDDDRERAKANVAIVIDKSGSMQGDNIDQARRAAVAAVEQMSDDDIVSVVTYDDSVHVLVPATKASDRDSIRSKIQSIEADGSTALFAGVSKAAAEVRKFLDDDRVNRVILLSDGKANVGPSSPSELQELGESLSEEGMSVSTLGLGLGYNEDLMSRLALGGNGNHVFIEDADELVGVFEKEFEGVSSVVAKDIRFRLELADGVRPVKVLNYPSEIDGQIVELSLGQLYARQERYFVLEVEIPTAGDDSRRELAQATVKYYNMQTKSHDRLSSDASVRFSRSQQEVDRSVDKKVLADCVLQIANEKNRMATELRDSGNVSEAKKLLEDNARYLGGYGSQLNDKRLEESGKANDWQAKNLDEASWNLNRKLMRQRQYGDATNQTYGSASELAR